MSNQTYHNYENYNEKCCVSPGKHILTCEDTYGDGWHGGYLQFKDMFGNYWGNQYCKDFTSGHKYSTEVTIHSTNGKQNNIIFIILKTSK